MNFRFTYETTGLVMIADLGKHCTWLSVMQDDYHTPLSSLLPSTLK